MDNVSDFLYAHKFAYYDEGFSICIALMLDLVIFGMGEWVIMQLLFLVILKFNRMGGMFLITAD